MIANITVWIKEIILVVLFSSFLELLLPNSSMQRFVRVIVGLFILLAILNPFIGFIENKLTPSQLPAIAHAENSLTNANVLKAANSVTEKREKLATDLYVKDLSKQIRATVMSIDGITDAKVSVAVEPAIPEGKRTGKIKNVVIYIEPGINNNERNYSKITIGVTNSQTEETAKKLSPAVIEKTIRVVTELYQLKPSQVEVMRMN